MSEPRYGMPDWDGMQRDLSERLVPEPDVSQGAALTTAEYRFVDTRPLARWLIAMLLLGMITRGVGAGTSWVLRNWFAGESKPVGSAVTTFDLLALGAGITTLLLTAVAGILWVVWLWQAYSNLPALGRPQPYRRFWVWLGWFVPIWSLFRPKQIHNEVWRSGGGDWVPLWVHLWWFLFLIEIVSLNAVSSTQYTWADVIANGIGILAAIPAIAVIWVSATRQRDKRHAAAGTPAHRTGLVAKFTPAGVGLLSFGLAALLILIPHSEDLPEGTTVVAGLLDVEPGECFTASDAEDLGLIWIVDCSTPHVGESVGTVEVNAASYPGLNTLADFGTIGCWSAFYEYAGDTAENLDYQLDWYSPLGTSWGEGYSSILCTVSHIERTPLSTSVADTESRWIALEHLREGQCYEFHSSLLVAAELPCSNGALKVGSLKRYENDPLVDFPGEEALHDDLSCPATEALGPILPTAESWSLGDRVSLCLTEEPVSA